MNPFTTRSRIIVTCNKRLTPYLEREIVDLGFTPVRTFATGLELEGTMTDCIRLNMNLRCASQVHYSLASFRIGSPDDLYERLREIPWENYLADDGYVSITNNTSHPSIRNSMFPNVKVKDAIVDRMRAVKGRRPDTGPELDRAVVHLYWKDDDAEIFIDTSGETLAKHGYRKIPGRAPMLEALAAATIMATRWDGSTPFVNPMCGSSTLAIEAAMIATKRVPGLFRENYAFMHVRGYDESLYRQELRRIRGNVTDRVIPGIIATDINADAIEISRVNAGIAGVDELISFGVMDFEKTPVPDGPGVVFFNPEYGERLGELEALENTYRRIGDFMKQRCQGYTGYIFTGNPDLAKKIGLKASRRIEFFNAKIDCRLLEYELYSGSRRKDREDGSASREV